jgi:hypothetical protein
MWGLCPDHAVWLGNDAERVAECDTDAHIANVQPHAAVNLGHGR